MNAEKARYGDAYEKALKLGANMLIKRGITPKYIMINGGVDKKLEEAIREKCLNEIPIKKEMLELNWRTGKARVPDWFEPTTDGHKKNLWVARAWVWDSSNPYSLIDEEYWVDVCDLLMKDIRGKKTRVVRRRK